MCPGTRDLPLCVQFIRAKSKKLPSHWNVKGFSVRTSLGWALGYQTTQLRVGN